LKYLSVTCDQIGVMKNRGSGSVLTKHNETPAQTDRFPAMLMTIFGPAMFWRSSIPENSIMGFV
jgi:hypothetical protein